MLLRRRKAAETAEKIDVVEVEKKTAETVDKVKPKSKKKADAEKKGE